MVTMMSSSSRGQLKCQILPQKKMKKKPWFHHHHQPRVPPLLMFLLLLLLVLPIVVAGENATTIITEFEDDTTTPNNSTGVAAAVAAADDDDDDDGIMQDDERRLPIMSMTQFLVTMIASILSLIGSGCIVYMSYQNFYRSILQRLLFGLSLSDMVVTFTILLTQFFLPPEVQYYTSFDFLHGRVGNFDTCTILGAVFCTFCVVTPLYSAYLSIYYLSLVKYRWQEPRIKPQKEQRRRRSRSSGNNNMAAIVVGRIRSLCHIRIPTWEFAVHCLTIIVPAVLAIAGAFTNSIRPNSIFPMCGMVIYPYGCELESYELHRIEECHFHSLVSYRVIEVSMMSLMGIATIVSITCTFLVYWTVRRTLKQTIQFNKRHSVQQNAVIVNEKGNGSFSNNREQQLQQQQIQQDKEEEKEKEEETTGQNTFTATKTTTAGHHSLRRLPLNASTRNKTPAESNNFHRRIQQVATQATYYFLSYANSYMWVSITYGMTFILTSPIAFEKRINGDILIFIINLLASIFYPLQGFFNFSLYKTIHIIDTKDGECIIFTCGYVSCYIRWWW